MAYNPAAVASYFDDFGPAEWERFDQTLGDRVSLALHTEVLQQFIQPGHRVLEIGAGPGRFTEILHRIGARIVVADISAVQLGLNRETARTRGSAPSIEAWHQLDICDLGVFPERSFDEVVAFGGPLSYVFEQRDRALAECIRVLRPGGHLLLSVMSLWGSMHRLLEDVRDMSRPVIRDIVRTGDVTPETEPTNKHYCHLFRSSELRAFLERPGLEIVRLSATSGLTTGVPSDFVKEPAQWEALLEYDREACRDPGCLDAGTHLLAVVRSS